MIRERDETTDQVRRELRALILQSGLTQRQIEEANGFGPGYVSQVLNGTIALTMRQLMGISLAIGLPMSELFPAEVPLFDEIRQRMARFDAALAQLESQGLVKLPDRPR